MKRAIAVILSLMLLTGCAPVQTAPEETPQETPAPVEEVEVEEVPAGDPRPEEVKVLTERPTDLDPVRIRSSASGCLLEIYEPLFYTESVGGELLGALADISRGEFGGYDHAAGTAVYSIYLRSGIYDHAGNALTAEDAAFCYQRLAEAEGWTLWQGAEAVDDTQLDLRFTRELTAPGELRTYLDEVYLYTQAAYEAQGALLAAACGTGPYTFESFAADKSLRVTETENYWDAEHRSARAAANVQAIEYFFVDGAAERVIALETGHADMADCLDYADTEDFRGEGVYTDTFRVHQGWSQINNVLVPNINSQSLMDNTYLRQGIFYAIDNNVLADCFGVGGGRAVFTVGNPDYPDIPETWGSAENYQTQTLDVNEVRSYLRQASYVNESLGLLVTAGTSGEQLASGIQAMLHPMSITVNIIAVDAETFETTLADAAAWDMAILSAEVNNSVAEVWQRIWADRTVSGMTVGSVRDSALQKYLQDVSTEAGCTQERMTTFMDFVMEKAYGMGLAQKCRAIVVPVGVTEVYLTGRSDLLPGACVFLTE